MGTLLRKLRWSVAQRGLLGTLKAVPRALTRSSQPADSQHPFDQRYGTDTSGVIGGGSLATGHPHDVYITAYAGIAPSRLEAALNLWSSKLVLTRIEDYTFIDLGCGKGRALLLASRLPFLEVIGIELNPELATIAENNANRWRRLGKAVSPIRIVVGDATQPVLPDGPVLLFLYNSFAEPMVHRLASHLNHSTISHPVDLIYQNAYHAEVFSPQPGFRELWRTTLPLSVEDANADPVASPDDLTILYRFAIK